MKASNGLKQKVLINEIVEVNEISYYKMYINNKNNKDANLTYTYTIILETTAEDLSTSLQNKTNTELAIKILNHLTN